MKRLIALLAVMLACACGAGASNAPSTTEVVGTPPSPDEDPYFYVARPPPEAKAEKQGTIGDPAPAEEKADPRAKVDTSKISAESRAELSRLEARNVELKARALELRNELAEAHQATKKAAREEATLRRELAQLRDKAGRTKVDPTLKQCHSCVRLCPIRGRCDKSKAEVVCGWGTGKSESVAKRRATAECDGALAGMQANGMFSRVEGQCPSASCQ